MISSGSGPWQLKGFHLLQSDDVASKTPSQSVPASPITSAISVAVRLISMLQKQTHASDACNRLTACDGKVLLRTISPAAKARVVAEVLDLDLNIRADKRRANSILRTWIDNGVLKIEERKDQNGIDRKFVIVGDPA